MKIDSFFRYYKKILMRLLMFPVHLFPVKKNRVLLMNALSQNYSDNPKYVAEYLLQHYPGRFEIIFPVKSLAVRRELAKKGLIVVKYNSLPYFYYALTCKVFLTNSGGFSYLPMRKQQYIINTWHGGGAYKKCGLDMYEDTPLFRKDLLLAGSRTDLFFSSCKRFTDVISASMLTPKEVFWNVGMPRNDILCRSDSALRQRIRNVLGLQDGEKLVLFAPTYRKPNDNYFKKSIAISYGIDSDRVCRALEHRFGSTWRFGYRLHPCVSNHIPLSGSNVLDISDYPDMQELLLAADAMITDFSSSLWDFMLTGKPSFLFALDLEHYIKTTQVYTPVEEWPFPRATNNDQLEKNILEFSETDYAAACKQHYEDLGGCETGEATKLACQRIYERCYPGIPSESQKHRYLFINSVAGFGSTGRIAADLCRELIAEGHQCLLAYGRDMVNCSDVPTIRIGSALDYELHGLMTRVTDKHGFGSKTATKRFLEAAQEYDPDILWLHNIHGYYLNIDLLFKWIKSRPNMQVKWTLHDCWSFTGHCAYFSFVGCERWKTGCHNCPQKSVYPASILLDNSKNNYIRKKNAFTGIPNMTLTVPSQWLANLVKQSFLREYPVEVRYNTIDTSIFKPTSGDFRKKYGLEDKKIILGVANVWEARKGLSDFLALAKMLDEQYQIVLVGLSPKQLQELPDNILGITRTNSAVELAEIYSAADVYVNPSREETFGLTTVEALSCGTVPIVYRGTACEEITEKFGGIAVEPNVEAIYTAVIMQTQTTNQQSQ